MNEQPSTLFNNALATIRGVGISSPVHARWKLEFLIDGRIIRAMDVYTVKLKRDFVSNYTDELKVEVTTALGDYIYDIFPNRANLTIQLYKIPLHPKTLNDLETSPIVTQMFKGVLHNPVDYQGQYGDMISRSKTELNRQDIHRFEVQLIDSAIWACRGWHYSGTVYNQNKEDLLTSVLQLPDTVEGVTVSTLTADPIIANLVIPDGIQVTEFPGWLQANGGGVYNAGIGWYFQRGYWWVYPLYDTSRYASEDKTLTIINIPQTKLDGVEATYVESGEELFILATGEIEMVDTTDSSQLTNGTGLRVAKQNLLAEDPMEETVSLDRKANLLEMVSEKRVDANIAYFSKNLQRENIALELSKLASSRGILTSLEWENSELSKLDPGMPVRLLYENGGSVVKLEGTLLGVEALSRQTEAGAQNRQHATKSQLSLFLNRTTLGGIND